MTILDGVGANVNPPDDGEFLVEDESFSNQYPGIFEFLSRIKVNGQDRKPGRLIVYYEAGKCHLCLADKHTKSCAFHAGDGVNEALEACEGRLQAGKLDWRRSKRAMY